MQVEHSGGVGRLGETVASIGESYSQTQTPAKRKAQLQIQARILEGELTDFRSNQEVIRGVQPKSDAAQAFDASGMA
jgi:hypothetical protein